MVYLEGNTTIPTYVQSCPFSVVYLGKYYDAYVRTKLSIFCSGWKSQEKNVPVKRRRMVGEEQDLQSCKRRPLLSDDSDAVVVEGMAGVS